MLTTTRQDGLPYLDGEMIPAEAVQGSMGLAHVRANYFDVTGGAFRIVGVVSNVKTFGIADTETRYHVYLPGARPNPSRFVRFFVRTTGDPGLVIEEARRRIAAIDRALPMSPPEMGIEVIRRQTAQHRFVAVLLSGLAVLGLTLALSGIYASVALNVSRRTREIAAICRRARRRDRSSRS